MTIALQGNAQGGVIIADGTAAENVTQASGIPFMKNKLLNGEVTRINQRNVSNWAAVANGAYGYDRWKKLNASNMTQIIEGGNFRPSTVHTLSGVGVTTQQITSPASGDWQLPNIPITATNVQVEEGLEATPFEVRHIAFELALCKRYYEVVMGAAFRGQGVANDFYGCNVGLVEKRVTPSVVVVAYTATAGCNAPYANAITATGFRAQAQATGTGLSSFSVQYAASAEL